MPDLSKDDFRSAMSDSLTTQEIQRQNELLQSMRQDMNVQNESIQQAQVATQVESEAMIERLDSLRNVLIGQGIDQPTMNISPDTVQEMSESISIGVDDIPTAQQTTGPSEGVPTGPMMDQLESIQNVLIEQQSEGSTVQLEESVFSLDEETIQNLSESISISIDDTVTEQQTTAVQPGVIAEPVSEMSQQVSNVQNVMEQTSEETMTSLEESQFSLDEETVQNISESVSVAMDDVAVAQQGDQSIAMGDKMDQMVMAQQQTAERVGTEFEEFGGLGDQLTTIKNALDKQNSEILPSWIDDSEYMNETLQQQIQVENMSQDELINLGESLQTFIEKQQLEGEAGSQVMDQMQPMISTIEQETGEPMRDVRQALMNADGQMSLGNLMANKFEALKGTVKDNLTNLKDSLMSGLSTLTQGLMGVFEGGQSILGLLTSAFSGVFSTFGPMIGTWIANALGFESIKGAIMSGFSSLSMTGLLAGAGFTLGGGVLLDLFMGTGKTAGLLGMAIDNLGGVLPMIQWLFGIETDLSISNMISSMFGLEDFSLGAMFQRRFAEGAEGLQMALQATWDNLIVTPISATFDTLMSPIDSTVALFNGIVSMGGDLMDWIASMGEEAINPVIGMFESLWEAGGDVVEWFMNLGGTLGNMFMDSIQWLSDQISNFFDSTVDTLSNIGSSILEIPGMLFNLQKQLLSSMVDAILGIPSSILGAVESGLRMVGMDTVANGIGTLKQAIQNLPSTIMSGLKQLPSMITRAVQSIPGKITKAIYELPSMLWTKMQNLPSLIANSLSDLMPGTEDIPGAETASNIASSVTDTASSALSAVNPFAKGGIIEEPTVGIGMETQEVKTFAEAGPEAVIPTAKVQQVSGGDAPQPTVSEGQPAPDNTIMSTMFDAGGGDEAERRDDEKVDWLKKIYQAIQNMGGNTGDNVNSVPPGLTDTEALRISRGTV